MVYNKNNSYDSYYLFAIGYYDGRTKGISREDVSFDHRYHYNAGYEAGVSDYCKEELVGEDE